MIRRLFVAVLTDRTSLANWSRIIMVSIVGHDSSGWSSFRVAGWLAGGDISVASIPKSIESSHIDKLPAITHN